jgi:NAD(P)-dependent dehydrogenase (short-subunit alcohol dehydrogenase family)
MTKAQDVLIIGANRGIGFELTQRLLSHGHTVYGTYRPQSRDDASVSQLQGAGAQTLEVDLVSEESIVKAAAQFADKKLDILINCAGIYNQWEQKAFTEHTAEDLEWFFKVNVVGPFLTTKYFLPALSKSALGKVINISSDSASIADNTGGNVCYRLSKCALNQLTRTTAMDLRRLAPTVVALAVHPGFLPTKMTGFYGEDDLEECMTALVDLVEKFGHEGEEGMKLENGSYVKWNGQRIDY